MRISIGRPLVISLLLALRSRQLSYLAVGDASRKSNHCTTGASYSIQTVGRRHLFLFAPVLLSNARATYRGFVPCSGDWQMLLLHTFGNSHCTEEGCF
ncbi:hypothetical protein F4820DRAFT_213631 [Hypoxylon rubiginosum]|uniref:Uncharacterized protein n=1 Tax=Hypoxylon rubiginosum TaxID=110542 RepID=A0ACB9Z7C6_9PEZI|nr:hypothetical protein F4820DRAFT_213631 [Hypoxylon rubiginosum]